jgi:hypothetical protein
MRGIDLGLRTALIVTPVNVLHNWRKEFMKWTPSEVKPIRVFMLEDVSRFCCILFPFFFFDCIAKEIVKLILLIKFQVQYYQNICF